MLKSAAFLSWEKQEDGQGETFNVALCPRIFDEKYPQCFPILMTKKTEENNYQISINITV